MDPEKREYFSSGRKVLFFQCHIVASTVKSILCSHGFCLRKNEMNEYKPEKKWNSAALGLIAKKHTSQNLRYYYVIKEMGKLVISRWYDNSCGNTDIIIWGCQVKWILFLIMVESTPFNDTLSDVGTQPSVFWHLPALRSHVLAWRSRVLHPAGVAKLNALFNLLAWHEKGNSKRCCRDAEHGNRVAGQELEGIQQEQIVAVQTLADHGQGGQGTGDWSGRDSQD